MGRRQGPRPEPRPPLRHAASSRASAATRPTGGPAVFRHRSTSSGSSKSAELYYLELPYSAEEIREATHELIRRNGLRSCYIRPLAFRGYGEMGLYAHAAPVDVMIAVWPWGAYLGDEGKRNGIRAKVSSWRRISPAGPHPAREGLGPVPELDPRQDRVGQGRLRRGDPARRARLRLRGLGREHLRGPRRRSSSRRRTRLRSSTGSRRKSVIQIAARPRLRRWSSATSRAQSSTSPTRSSSPAPPPSSCPCARSTTTSSGDPGEITRAIQAQVRGRPARARPGVRANGWTWSSNPSKVTS